MGEKIPFIEKPPIMTLAEWRELYPETLVLLRDAPPEPSEEAVEFEETMEPGEVAESDETVAAVTVTDDA